jgi:hypothetical protein
MPNDFETANGFSVNDGSDAGLDADGDGMTNLQEYQAGTNPRSAASVLRINSVEKSGGDIVVTFPSVVGKTYRVEASPGVTGAWFILSDNLHGTNDLISVSDVEATDQGQQRFYRVGVTP